MIAQPSTLTAPMNYLYELLVKLINGIYIQIKPEDTQVLDDEDSTNTALPQREEEEDEEVEEWVEVPYQYQVSCLFSDMYYSFVTMLLMVLISVTELITTSLFQLISN